MPPQDALDALPDGVVLAGPDGRVVLTNAMARRMLGITEDLTGVPLIAVLALSDHDGNGWVESNDPYGGLSTRTAVPEQPWILPDGTEVLVAARLHRSERGGPVETVALSMRSGRGRARLDRERSDLVATVAHELRSPLTGVRGFVHALINRWDKLSDEQKKLMLNTVAADADRLTRLIAELLDVARIDTGRLQMHARPCDLVVLTGRVVESVQHATSRRITFTADEVPQIAGGPGQGHPGRDQLGRERRTTRRGRRRPSRSCRIRTTRRTSRSRSPTRVPASPRSCGNGCSPSSGRRARAVAPGSGSTSSTAWSAPTVAPSPSMTDRAAGPP